MVPRRSSFGNNGMTENFNLSHTSQTPENGCRKAALSNTPVMIKEKSALPGKCKLDRMMMPEGQCPKKKRQMDENDDHKGAKRSSSSMKQVFRAEDEGEQPRCWSYGFISMIGRRREMEDAVAVEMGLPTGIGLKQFDFFGVYDGHGGSRVAHACKERLHKLLAETVAVEQENNGNKNGEVGGEGGIIEWENVMLECFNKMDAEVNRNGAAVATMGSTAVVAVVGEEEVVVANCGDSRAVLFREGVPLPLSIDHKPDRADELERIELCGGKVINWNGQRVLGVLSTSRSIGDEYLKPYVIPVPQVTVSQRSDGDEFLILASDGLWDVIPNDVACHVVRRCLDGNVRRKAPPHLRQQVAQLVKSATEMRAHDTRNGGPAAEAASILAELAIARGSRDNISVIVVQLERPKSVSDQGGSGTGTGTAAGESSSGTKDEKVSS